MVGSSDPAIILHILHIGIGTIPRQNQWGFKSAAELLDLRHELALCPKRQRITLMQLAQPRPELQVHRAE